MLPMILGGRDSHVTLLNPLEFDEAVAIFLLRIELLLP